MGTISTIRKMIDRADTALAVSANDEPTLDELARNVDRARSAVEAAFEAQRCRERAGQAEKEFDEAESTFVAAMRLHLVKFKVVRDQADDPKA